MPPLKSNLACRRVTRSSRYAAREGGSAPLAAPARPGRQFPPSLCRCADYPLRGIPLTPGGFRAPQTPRGPQAPFAGPSGHYRSVMEAPPPNLRCSPAQGLGVVVSKAFSFHTPPPWAAPRGGCASGSRTPPNGKPFNLYRSRGGTKGTPVARPTSMGRPPRGAGRGFPYPKSRLHPIGRPPHRARFRTC